MRVKLPAFQRLVDDHWEDVARLAHALAGPAFADDVAQQTWAKALAAYGQLQRSSNLRSWLLTITAHCAMDVYRASAREAVPVPDLADLEGDRGGPMLPAGSSGPGLRLGPEDAGDPLWVAVRCLPERQRAAIALRYIADLDHAQIADALGVTSANSRRLVSDALGALRAVLAQPAADPAEPDSLHSIQEDHA